MDSNWYKWSKHTQKFIAHVIICCNLFFSKYRFSFFVCFSCVSIRNSLKKINTYKYMALLLHTNEMRETKNRFPKENARFSTIVLITFLFEVSNCGEFWKITILKFKVGQPSITHLIKLVETCLCFHYAKAFFHI